MAKYVFSKTEKSAVWKAHNRLCFWCGDVLEDLRQVTIDHLFPEDFLSKPEKWKVCKTDYALGDDFRINSFENWVPAHFQCNSSKRTTVYQMGPVMIKAIHEAGKRGEEAKRIHKNLCKSLEKSDAAAQIEALIEAEKISKEEIVAMFAETRTEAENVAKIVDEIVSRLSPRWKIVSVDESLAIASDGKMSGSTWVGKDEPHYSWRCPTCGSMGPWSGARCMNCGHFSDD
jgi:hypothetical protein